MLRVRRQIGCSDELIEKCGLNGVTVAMLDTGVANHPDFGNRVIAFKDFLNNKDKQYDDSGHGTHVAGCICGNGIASAESYKGIAPTAKLIVGKVLNHVGDGSIEDVCLGMKWILAIQRDYGIRVVNISIGMNTQAEKGKINQLLELIDTAWEHGLIVVCAAGNTGPTPMSISLLGAGRHVITVGCHEGGYFGNRQHLCEHYSGRGPSSYVMKKPDIVAPGTDIISCNAFFSKRGRFYKNAYIAKSGTSMATPIISGALALLLQKFPFYTNEQAKQKLLHTALDLKEPWSKQGWGMIQVDKLMK